METKQATEEPTIIVCFAHVDQREVRKQECPTCESEQEFYCTHEEWYGWTETCLNCGDRWMDGELCPRPFERGWRKQNIEWAKDQVEKMRAHDPACLVKIRGQKLTVVGRKSVCAKTRSAWIGRRYKSVSPRVVTILEVVSR